MISVVFKIAMIFVEFVMVMFRSAPMTGTVPVSKTLTLMDTGSPIPYMDLGMAVVTLYRTSKAVELEASSSP